MIHGLSVPAAFFWYVDTQKPFSGATSRWLSVVSAVNSSSFCGRQGHHTTSTSPDIRGAHMTYLTVRVNAHTEARGRRKIFSVGGAVVMYGPRACCPSLSILESEWLQSLL
jgi:hypothetical protein